MLLFVDHLCNVDFSYLDAERGLVGETWLANIELEGALDEQGMVCDFGAVKSLMRRWLDENIDHALLIPAASPALKLKQCEQSDTYTWQLSQTKIEGKGPKEAHAILDGVTDITPESVASWCVTQLKKHFPETVSSLRLSFSIESIDGPYYHYSHGLKKHGGNCQRIAHGHRSKIEIWCEGELDLELMAAQASLWKDIYIGTREDLINSEADNNYHFQYTSQQGEFALSIPKRQCYLIDSESTVEHIAQHILENLQRNNPQSSFRVKAFEGISKGAIASSV